MRWSAWLLLSALVACSPAPRTKLIVGYPPGGTFDLMARQVAARQGWVVINMPGASSKIAVEEVRNHPDELLWITVSNVIGGDPHLYLVGGIVQQPLVLTARSDSSDQLATVGVTGKGGLGEFLLKGQFNGTIVYYNGGAESVKDLLGGIIDGAVNSLPVVEPYIESGQLKIVKVLGQQWSGVASARDGYIDITGLAIDNAQVTPLSKEALSNFLAEEIKKYANN